MLAGDNAIVVGMAAAGVPLEQRRRVIFWGIGAAIALRIFFALITTQLLAIIGLTLAGGVLLLWVCWKMYRELRSHGQDEVAPDEAIAAVAKQGQTKSFGAAVWQILVADVSMSLDNVLAVAGAAMDHPTVLIIGLALSIALMGLAASFIARLLHKYRWIAYVGLLVILYVAIEMTLKGAYGQWPDQLSFLSAWFGAPGAMGH